MSSAKLPPTTEREVMRGLEAVIRSLGLQIHRQNVGAFTKEYKGKKRVIRCGRKGWLDYMGWLPDGRHCEIETKRPGKRPEREQLERMIAINEAGGVAFWTNSAGLANRILGYVLNGARVEVGRDGRVFLIRAEAPE